MKHLPVLIIGAGPTGLTLACELARRNIQVRIIERSAEYPNGSRAKGLQPRSLEVMDDLGIADELLAAGSTDLIFRRYNGNTLLGDVKREVFQRTDTRYVQGVIIPQWKVEEVLRAKLQTLGIKVELGTELINFSQTDNQVSAVLKTTQGEETVQCAYMIGCDGGKSTVRKALGINFEGETHEDERAFVGDVQVDGLTPDAWHIWLHPEVGFGFALCPFKCTDSWQVQTIALPDADGKLAEPGLETFRRLFAERTGMEGVTLKNATWASLYRVNVRMADRYRSGMVFIAGDAAHAHSIAGGLGMNTGIQDAYNLGWKLAAVLTEQANESLLDTYEEERLPIAAWTLNISSERQKIMTDSLKTGDGGLHTIGTKDTTQLNLNYRYSSLSKQNNEQPDGLQAGDRAPDGQLPDGRRLFDLYRGTHFTILKFAPANVSIERLSERYGDQVKTFTLDNEAAASFGSLANVYVIRPDGYIGLIANGTDETAISTYLDKFMIRQEV
ncbi:FAD-dependent monooxygenase [Mucilaginibacter aquaedulcis]|uniref:FAD-dependent monooxygenase n=1 Tax=Mucilaginibacter aquaedulcis TaxID=1187081 RepID=UPI0025B5101F|nr:FAD-dependent monooxygenase [Mucilaginibacter aquaedulcis]MDN3548588.1 FAD-dependent monooxygenase [Mucilaginibacter aquaedulcis]